MNTLTVLLQIIFDIIKLCVVFALGIVTGLLVAGWYYGRLFIRHKKTYCDADEGLQDNN